MNQLSYYVTKRLIVGSKDSSGTIIQFHEFNWNGMQIDGMKPQRMTGRKEAAVSEVNDNSVRSERRGQEL